MGWFSSKQQVAVVEPVEDYAGEEEKAETPEERRARKGAELQEAKRAATERYAAIAELIKREAGVRKHFKHKSISGLAISGTGKILAPEGITRRQLYVLAHECAHILLHSSPAAMRKPSHVKELEAEVYAHRTFKRYGLEVPEKSARWARAYVGHWIMKDRAAGVPISQEAVAWAEGKRAPDDLLPAVDGQPRNDFSRSIEKFIAKSVREVEQQEALMGREPEAVREEPVRPTIPNACGTCVYLIPDYKYHGDWCEVHRSNAASARSDASECNNGQHWHPHPKEISRLTGVYHAARPGFISRLGDAIIDRVSGRKIRNISEPQIAPPNQSGEVVKITDRSRKS